MIRGWGVLCSHLVVRNGDNLRGEVHLADAAELDVLVGAERVHQVPGAPPGNAPAGLAGPRLKQRPRRTL